MGRRKRKEKYLLKSVEGYRIKSTTTRTFPNESFSLSQVNRTIWDRGSPLLSYLNKSRHFKWEEKTKVGEMSPLGTILLLLNLWR